MSESTTSKKEDEDDITMVMYRKLIELNKDGALDRKFEQDRINKENELIEKRKIRGLSNWGGMWSLTDDGRYSLMTFQLQSYDILRNTFLKDRPLVYDEQQIWWAWNSKDNCWKATDEVTILIEFDHCISISDNHTSIQSFTKNTILEALKRVGRKYHTDLKPIKDTWVAFKDCIVDVSEGVSYKNDPQFFATNVIPYNIWGTDKTDTPTMDRLFKDWVGEKYVQTLYEILAYCMLSDYPIHRLFCLIGSGRNGKSSFIRILLKFIGQNNATSTELESLTNNPFTSSKLYKKLICILGETNFNMLRNTETIKKLTGQDPISAQFKHKPLFDFQNYAKIIIATNSLPQSLDKTYGFYSRWQIIDFPNRFSEAKDVLSEIPEEEYENLARKSIIILRELLKNRKFSNEGSLEQRVQAYEDKSNPLQKFIRENYEFELNEYVIAFKFYDDFSNFLRKNGYRQLSRKIVGQAIRDYGVESKKEWIDYFGEKKQWVVYWGLKSKKEDAPLFRNAGGIKICQEDSGVTSKKAE